MRKKSPWGILVLTAFVADCSPDPSASGNAGMEAAANDRDGMSVENPGQPIPDDGIVRACSFDGNVSGTKTQCESINVSVDLPKLDRAISAPQLSAAYIQNQVSANDAFTLKRIHVFGAMTGITEDASVVTIEYAAPYQMPVKATLSEYQIYGNKIVSAHDAAAHFLRGQTSFLACDNRGVVFGSLSLVNCMIEAGPVPEHLEDTGSTQGSNPAPPPPDAENNTECDHEVGIDPRELQRDSC